MTTIYTYNLLIPKYINDESLCNLSLVSRYWSLVSNENCKLRNAIKQGWKNLAEKGDLDGIKLLHKYKIEGCTTYAMDRASLQGHLEVVKFLHYNRTEGCTTNAMNWASINGHLDVVEYLKSIGAPS